MRGLVREEGVNRDGRVAIAGGRHDTHPLAVAVPTTAGAAEADNRVAVC